MKPSRRLLIAALTAAPAAGVLATAAATAAGQSERRTVVRDLSGGAGENWRLWISIPSGDPPAAGWPVLWVTDGNAYFQVAAAVANLQDDNWGRAVIVGVGHPVESQWDPRRVRDLTWWPVEVPLPFHFSDGVKGGGAATFADFLIGPARRAAEGEVSIDPKRRGLFGHSLAGLFVLTTLFSHPNAFDTWIAASPSIWWRRAALLQMAEKAQVKPGLRVLVTTGEREDVLSRSDIDWIDKDRQAKPENYDGTTLAQALAVLRERIIQQNMRGFARHISELLKERGLNSSFIEYPDEDHQSVATPALNRGLRLLLRE